MNRQQYILYFFMGVFLIAAFYCSSNQIWFFSVIFLLLALVSLSGFFFVEETPGVAVRVLPLFFYFFLLLIILVTFANIYTYFGIYDLSPNSLSKTELTHNEESAFYFSIVTFTTLGYGDFQPSEEARGYAAFQAVVGYVFLGMFVAKLLHLLKLLAPKENA